MRTKHNYHLTYCTNIHPEEDWNRLFNGLKHHLPGIKQHLSPENSFGIGLRLSNENTMSILFGNNLLKFKLWLKENDFYIFTLNGFPYGSFHGETIKDNVHKPDWTDAARVNYTRRLFQILSHCLPKGIEGGISTSPLSYKPWFKENELGLNSAWNDATKNILEIVVELIRYNTRNQQMLHLDLEPEPDGLIENTEDIIRYFSQWLIPLGVPYLSKLLSISSQAAETAIRNHVRICYDVCHFAIVYEDPQTVFSRLETAGIKIGKIQLSAALKAELSQNLHERGKVHKVLDSLNKVTYLHQVIEQEQDKHLTHYPDLPMALNNLYRPGIREWRLHFHIPIFWNTFEHLLSTQNELINVLEILKQRHITDHLEVETYTWEILPKNLRLDLSSSIQRELEWVLTVLN